MFIGLIISGWLYIKEQRSLKKVMRTEMNKLEQLYEKIPYQVFNFGYVFFLITMVGAWGLTALEIEELTLGCTGNTTVLQIIGLPMDFNGVCNEKFINNSVIFIIGSGIYGWQCSWVCNLIIKASKTKRNEDGKA
jgi:hypothetical protein